MLKEDKANLKSIVLFPSLQYSWKDKTTETKTHGRQDLRKVRGREVAVAVTGQHKRYLCGDGIHPHLDYGTLRC